MMHATDVPLVTYMYTNTVSDRIAFYHSTMFSLTIFAWFRAIDAGLITTWTHLTSKQVRQNLPESTSMLKVHMDQTRANNHSTQPLTYADSVSASLTQAPVPETSIYPEVFDTVVASYTRHF